MPKRSSVRITKRAVDAARPCSFLWDSEVPGFGLRVTPAGSRSFIAQYRTHDGKQGRTVLGSYPTFTTEDARALAKLALAKVAEGGDPVAARKARREAPTLDDLAREYLESYAPAASLKASTVRDAKAILARVLPVLGSRKVADFTVIDARKVHGDMRREAGVYQANRLRAVLSKMFSLAVEMGWRADNPCRGVRRFPEDQRWRNLSEAEVGRLFAACDKYENQNAADAIRLLLFSGARLREVLSAEWAQFDLEVGLWEKPSSHTKTKRQHRLELEGPALELLIAMRQRDPRGLLLFPGAERPAKPLLKPRCRSDLKRPWDWIREEAGLTNVRLHDLRRTTASFMISGGASLATVGKALGHTQASTTARYAQLSQSVQRAELRKAGERMAAATGQVEANNVVSLQRAATNGN